MNITYFKKSEFDCKCGCGLNNVNQELVELLEAARRMFMGPIRVTSGSRCKTHNIRVGGVKKSAHLSGLAADITPGIYSDARLKELTAIVDTLATEKHTLLGQVKRLKILPYYSRGFIHVQYIPREE